MALTVDSTRFIPQRSYSDTTSKHHVRKLPVELTADEKLLRQRERNEDPFGRRRKAPATSLHPQYITQAPHMSPHIVDDQAVPSQYSRTGQRITPRQVSVGAVWNVGGSSIATTRGPWIGITDRKKGYSGSKCTAPMYFARYESSQDISTSEESEMNRARLAAAFDMDLTHRQLVICKRTAPTKIHTIHSSPKLDSFHPLAWKDCAWRRDVFVSDTRVKQNQITRAAADAVPFHLIFATIIEDDFYRSVVAYCCTSGLLALASKTTVFLWSTSYHALVIRLHLHNPIEDEIEALAFSSANGKKSILAVATSLGYLHLWNTLGFCWWHTCQYNSPLSCVAFKPTTTTTRRLSAVIPNLEVSIEHLAVGDKNGMISYYSVEVSSLRSLSRMILLAKIDAHHGRICSISWSPDNKYLATSGDDDACMLFDLNHIVYNSGHFSTSTLQYPINEASADIPPSTRMGLSIANPISPAPQTRPSSIFGSSSWLAQLLWRRSHLNLELSLSRSQPATDSQSDTSSISDDGRSVSIDIANDQATRTYSRVRNRAFNSTNDSQRMNIPRSQPPRRVVSANYYFPGVRRLEPATYLPRGSHIHRFQHGSAVKAIAFAPWQPTLLATGGGMGDRTVHFYHAPSGSCLAKIYMRAQITGLIWSKTRREIAVVLGYPDPGFEHPFRIVVFAWPSCEQITAIPWNAEPNMQTYPYLGNVVERALSTISIPNFRSQLFGPEDDSTFNPEDECIVIASCKVIRFYRIWCNKPHKQLIGSVGVMTSAILESMDGIENPRSEIIR